MREKLIEFMEDLDCNAEHCSGCEYWQDTDGCVRRQKEIIADRLIANGVTIQKWIPVSERLPENFVSVLGYMTDAGEFPPVRECYTVGSAFYFPALCDKHPVSHWMPLPEPPKEE